MSTNRTTIDSDCYTLKAQVKLRMVEENEQLKNAIRGGDQKIFDEILKNTVQNQLTWEDHIKRYIYDQTSDGTTSIDYITHQDLVDFIYKSFSDNGLCFKGDSEKKTRASLNPEDYAKLEDCLEDWLSRPVTKISRKNCFLFAFGLNMDEEQTRYMLTCVLRQADFNARDPKEAIYYYCLRKNLKYAGVKEWLKKYKKLTAQPVSSDVKTVILKKDLLFASEYLTDSVFEEHLNTLKSLPVNKKKSATRALVFRDLVQDLDFSLDLNLMGKPQELRDLALSIDFKFLEETLLGIDTKDVLISDTCHQLFAGNVIKLPLFSQNTLYDKIGQRTTEVHREDIIMAAYLSAAYEMEGEEGDAPLSYQERKATFHYEANLALDKCGFSPMYLLNPFELFLTSCLLQEKPFTYFLAVWQKYRLTAEDDIE